MKKLLAAALALAAIAFAALSPAPPAYAQGVSALHDARGKFVHAGIVWDAQNSNQPWSLQSGLGPDGTPLVKLSIQYPWEKWSGDGSQPKQRSQIAGNVTFAPGQTIHLRTMFQVDKLAKPLASLWGAVIGVQFHQAEQPGDRSNSPVYASYLMPEKDGSTSLTFNVNTTPDPTKEVSYHELVRLRNFAFGVPHSLDVTMIMNSASGGKLNVVYDGKQVVTYSGPVGIGNRLVYPAATWYDGGDSQPRAVSLWATSITGS